MKLLILGSGGREHAIAHQIAQSKIPHQLFFCPGNAGTSKLGTNISISAKDFSALYDFCIAENIDLLLPANEEPLVSGIRDFFEEKNQSSSRNILIVGPSKAAAQLEGSKYFSKEFMLRHQIPTAQYFSVNKSNLIEGKEFLTKMSPPYVLKVDGLAAGKGVLITSDLTEAQNILEEMIVHHKFGSSGNTVVVEEFLNGIEISVFVISDGENWEILGSAKDYKRVGEGDSGLNTGGMGAVSPVFFATDYFMNQVKEKIIAPTIHGLNKENTPFNGFLFIGLMNCNNDPYVIEYNVRMGDPETEVIFPRIESDALEMILAMANHSLDNYKLNLKNLYATTVFTCSKGYPGEIEKGKKISIPESTTNSIYFCAGVAQEQEELLTNGGRVVACTALASTLEEALAKSNSMANQIEFEGKFFRKDIGLDLIQLQQTIKS